LFAPLLNLWVAYRCLACPAGYAYHRKLDVPGIALALLYWLTVLLAVWLMADYLTDLLAQLASALKTRGLASPLRHLVSLAV
jgi:hypothetical protein